MVGGVVRAEFAERAVRWSAGLLDPEVRLVGLLQSWGRGQRGSNGAGGEEIAGRRRSLEVGPGGNPERARSKGM